jgi:TolA-binding protein
MTVLIPRIRTIGVRLSEDEYSTLEKFCVENGARSISDLARHAIWSFVNRANQESALASAVNTHSAQVRDLEQRLEQLTAEIALLKVHEGRVQNGAVRDHEETFEDQDLP